MQYSNNKEVRRFLRKYKRFCPAVCWQYSIIIDMFIRQDEKEKIGREIENRDGIDA